MTPVTTTHHPENDPSSREVRGAPRPLLERLRKGEVDAAPTTAAGARRLARLVVAHRAEFPAIPRARIAAAADRAPAALLEEARRATGDFLFGRGGPDAEAEAAAAAAAAGGSAPLDWWHGPRAGADAEEEVETAVRCFPSALGARGHHPLFARRHPHFPIAGLLHCSRAMAFVPLLAELGVELMRRPGGDAERAEAAAWFKDADRGGLACAMHNVFLQLVCNIVVRDDLGDEASGRLDEASVAILARLRERGLMAKEDIYDFDLVNLLLYHANYRAHYRYERRLHFLLDWDPSILRECGRGNPLLYHFARRLCAADGGRLHPGARRRFGTLLALGMARHPGELGFLFHGGTYRRACDAFGAGEVDAALFGAAARDRNGRDDGGDDERGNGDGSGDGLTLQALLLAAATNDEISLDGVYALLRRDPIALLP